MGQKLLRYRWFVMLWIGLTTLFLEIMERVQYHALYWDFSFISEVVISVIVLPVLGGGIIGWLERLALERSTPAMVLMRRDVLNRQVSLATTWDDLLRTIVEFPRDLAPVEGAVLAFYEPVSDTYEKAAAWGYCGSHFKPVPTSAANLINLPVKLHRVDPTPAPSSDDQSQTQPLPKVQYWLPLVTNGRLIALLYLYGSPAKLLNADQAQLVASLAPDMAIALESGRKSHEFSQYKKNTETEMRRLSRDLHDNLGQNLAFLHQRLSQLANEESHLDPAELKRTLQRLDDVAGRAAVEMRGILKEIEANTTAELTTALKDYTSALEDRLHFRVSFSITGRPQPVPAWITRQVIYIYGEILANVEEHAEAETVTVGLRWDPDSLVLSVHDNGCGFETHSEHAEGHLGLSIMYERAKEIHGKILVKSAPGEGTEVTLWLPINTAR